MGEDDRPPRELVIAGAVLACILGVIGLLVAAFYTPSPRPSPFGCYRTAVHTLIRLSPDFIIVPGAAPLRRRVTFDRTNAGLLVSIFNNQPYATFLDGTPAEPRLYLSADETMRVLDERRTIPTLIYNRNGAYLAAPKVDCPGRT